MKAILLDDRRPSLQDIPIPSVGPGEVLISVDACGLCGSDILKFDTPKNTRGILGHEVAGRILRKGPRTPAHLKVGDRVIVAHHVPCFKCHYCRRGSPSMCRQFKSTNIEPGGFSECTRVSEKHVRHVLFKIPAKLDSLSASLTEPLSCCLRNVKRLGLKSGDSAGIVGLGSIGLLTAQLLKRDGVSVLGFDLDPARVRVARDLGVEADDGKGAKERICEITSERGLDALIFTAGNTAMLAERLDWIRDGGNVNIFAELGGLPAALDLKEIYHRELTLSSSYSSSPEDMLEALNIIASGEVSVAPLIANTYPLSQFDEAVRKVRAREVLKAILVPAAPK